MRLTAKIIKVGTSKGVIIPSYVLKTLGIELDDQIDIEISNHKKPRDGWKEAFERYSEEYLDEDLCGSISYKVEYQVDDADRIDTPKVISITAAKPISGGLDEYAMNIIMDKEKVDKSLIYINEIIIL